MDVHFKYIFFLVCPVAPLTLWLVWEKLDSFQNVVMQKTPIATNDMNFLVFNIKVCMITCQVLELSELCLSHDL